jgi:hypothetical protein
MFGESGIDGEGGIIGVEADTEEAYEEEEGGVVEIWGDSGEDERRDREAETGETEGGETETRD